jgi:hypothetical protein
MVGFAGVTPIDTRVAAVTVRLEDAETPPRVAVIVVEPVPPAVAVPLKPSILLIEATFVTEELQVTEAVRSCTELSV